MDSNLKDILTFKTMITPLVVQVFFWLGIVMVVLGGLGAIFTGQFFYGLAMILIGPLLVRIYAELILVIFKINQGVQEIARK